MWFSLDHTNIYVAGIQCIVQSLFLQQPARVPQSAADNVAFLNQRCPLLKKQRLD
jgi:hypothetical protein